MRNIKEIRKKAKISQIELAKRTGLGRSTLVNYEAGKRVPRVNDLEKIAEALEVNICEFFRYE